MLFLTTNSYHYLKLEGQRNEITKPDQNTENIYICVENKTNTSPTHSRNNLVNNLKIFTQQSSWQLTRNLHQKRNLKKVTHSTKYNLLLSQPRDQSANFLKAFAFPDLMKCWIICLYLGIIYLDELSLGRKISLKKCLPIKRNKRRSLRKQLQKRIAI